MMEVCLSGLQLLHSSFWKMVVCSVEDFEFKFSVCVWLPKVKCSSSMCACSYKESKLSEHQQNLQWPYTSPRTDTHGQQVCLIMEKVNVGEREENYMFGILYTVPVG